MSRARFLINSADAGSPTCGIRHRSPGASPITRTLGFDVALGGDEKGLRSARAVDKIDLGIAQYYDLRGLFLEDQKTIMVASPQQYL
jgi:hypothetical protein